MEKKSREAVKAMGHGKNMKIKYSRIKKWLLSQYESTEKKSLGKRIIRYLSVLFFPYLALTALYFVFRWSDVKKANILFWICILIACQWFVFGPALVQRFTREFRSFQTDDDLPPEVKTYFANQNDRHMTIFIRYRFIEGVIFLLIAIIPVIIYPEILSKNLTNGTRDIFFWLIIGFLIWFLSYCVNATAYISLIAFHIINDLQKDMLLSYNPVLGSHRYAMNKISKLCGKAIRYVCTALLFIPFAIYYIYQQPELVINAGKTINFLPSSSQHPIYLIWVVSLLIFYSFFLFFFMTFQNVKIHGYKKKKSNSYLFNAQVGFINEDALKTKKRPGGPLSTAAFQYTEYLKLQEIRTLCKASPLIDIDIVVTYFSIVVSVLSAIQGIQKIIEWSPP